MTNAEQEKHDKVFYAFWEDIFDNMSDEVLESTIFMIKKFNALNALAKEEHDYRNETID